nr:hypothetical protein [Tanacetum cinerariifolium]
MFRTVGHIWRRTGRTVTLVGNVFPLTRIATTAIVPFREPIPIESNTDKPVVTLVYSRKSKAAKKKVPVSNPKINKSLVANKTEPKNSWGSTSSNVPSSLIECRTMNTTIKQQTAIDEALVPHAQRLRIGRSNFCLLSDIKSKESTLQLVYDVLRRNSG